MTTTAEKHPNLEQLQKIVAAFNGNDAPALEELVSPDFYYRMEGDSPLAGDYRGHEGMRQFMGAIHDASNGTISVVPISSLADDHWVIMYAEVTAERAGRRLEGQNVYIYEFADGKLSTGRNVPCDAATWDTFWS